MTGGRRCARLQAVLDAELAGGTDQPLAVLLACETGRCQIEGFTSNRRARVEHMFGQGAEEVPIVGALIEEDCFDPTWLDDPPPF